jgi:L-alanine-DL-glutamate epimerase-like enolase superfamily enzyme
MKIKSARAWAEKLPLTKTYVIAYKTISDTEIVFLEVMLENGLTGIGASNPFADVVGETPQVTLTNLKSGYLDEWVGKDIRHFNQLIADAAEHFPKLPGTLASIDIALHDLFCQFIGIPIVDFYGRKIQALPTSVTLGIKDTRNMLEEAKEYYKLGFKILKIKTGLNVEEDVERTLVLTEHFNRKMVIRVDANQGYSITQLQRFIKATKGYGVELIEQPMKVGLESQLSVLTDEDKKILVADESLLNAGSALQLSHPPTAYGVFNIKLMKSGGITGAKKIAVIAKNAGIQLFWGCNDESIVSIAAALHAAYSCSNTRYLDLDGSFDLSKDLVEGGFTLKDGCMITNGLPGLGVRKTS